MPLANRTIQPIWLGRRPLSEEEKQEDLALTAVSHNAVLGAIIQLASLVRHADDIFCDLAEECQVIFEKTESISRKIQNVETIVRAMDSTEVKIPVGTLKQFTEVSEHHTARHGFNCHHFTPERRPHCIKFQFSLCDTTPVHALRGVDLYRKDGLCSSHLFKLWPIALKDTEVHTEQMIMPKGKYPALSFKKRYKTLKLRQRPKTIHSIDEIFSEDNKLTGDLESSKLDQMSKSQPSIMVSVNTSGESFNRMASFRQSLKEDKELRSRDRKKRRRTVSGVPDNIMQEIEQFEKDRYTVRAGPRKYSLDDLDQKELEARDEIMQQYLSEIDAQIAEREELEYAQQKQAKLLKFIPCRRSRSLPRCMRLVSAIRGKDPLTRSSLYEKRNQKTSAEDMRFRQSVNGNQTKLTSSASMGSLSSNSTVGRTSRSAKRSSIIGSKIKSIVSGTLRPRPKSLDFDAIEVLDEDNTSKGKMPPNRSASMGRVSSPTMPEDGMAHAPSTESTIGPGSYYYFDSNTIPRAQAKKYDFPWDSLPKDWTTSVKLREISKRRIEDRQSSSGNWSQSGYSSNRQSMDSDARCSVPSSTSQHSLGRDSGRDSPLNADRDGLDTGYMGDAASTESVSETKSMSIADSDDWIRSLAERAASRVDVTSTSAYALASLSRITKQNIRNLDILVPGRTNVRKQRNDLEDDGESSVYSLDQEGFYTSFHNDSGLRRSSNTLLDDEDYDLMMPRVRESKSLQSVASYNTVDSVIFRPLDDDGSNDSKSTAVSSPNLTCTAFGPDSLSEFHESDISDINGLEHAGVEEYSESSTLKAKGTGRKKKRTHPPPPPRRSSSLSVQNIKSPTTTNNAKGNKGFGHASDSLPSTETSPESSDLETIHARLKMKTSISANSFPSWCISITSDDDDYTSRDTLSASQERLNAESSEIEEMFETGKDSFLAGTLPRTKITSGGHEAYSKSLAAELDYTANSWPRVKRFGTQQQGILKTPEKEKTKHPVGNPKILNFDPVVNLFDAGSPNGVQMPLSHLSSSDESGSPTNTSTFGFTSAPHRWSLSGPKAEHKADRTTTKNEVTVRQSSLPKNQPTPRISSVVKQSRPHSEVLSPTVAISTQRPFDHKSSHSKKVDVMLTEQDPYPTSSETLSSIHSGSTPSIASFDSFDMPPATPLRVCERSAETSGSSSTIAFSDFDSSSLTHVSLTDSTHSGSTLSLNWDTDNTPNPTPMATPIRKCPADSVLIPDSKENRVNEYHECAKIESSPYISHSISDQHSKVPSDSTKFPLQVLTKSSVSSTHPLKDAPKVSSSSSSISPSTSIVPTIALPESTLLSAPKLSRGPLSIKSQLSEPSAANIKPMQCTNFATSGAPYNKNLSMSHGADRNSRINTNSTFFVKQANSSVSAPLPKPIKQNYSNSSNSQLSQQPNSDGYSVKSERRRSSPVLGQVKQNHSIGNSGDSRGIHNDTQRRRSGNSLHSPADSGFGSPSIFSQPTPTSGIQSFTFSPETQPSLSQRSVAAVGFKVPEIKKPLLMDSKGPFTSHQIQKPLLSDGASLIRGDHHVKARNSSSDESLNSQFSTSSSNQLISRNGKTNLSRPVLRSGNSNESLHSNSSAGRNDSYRVALLSDCDERSLLPSSCNNSKTVINQTSSVVSRPVLTKSLSTPTAAYTDDIINRADSYRCAVRNTQSAILGDLTGRNSSYRLATDDEGVITDDRMDACNLWTGKTGASRDVRRMGITDIDQLKSYSNENEGRRSGALKNSVTLHSKKKLAVKQDEALNNKAFPLDQKRPIKPGSKDKSKQKTQSSTYIRFDPIFESGEDLRASSESLRPPSITSLRTLAKAESNETLTAENAHLIGHKLGPSSPTRKRTGSQSRKSMEEKSSMSFFGSIKTTIKSIGGGKGE